MNIDFSVFPAASFPVYTLSTDTDSKSYCRDLCALYWQPVLTSGPAEVGAGVDPHALGIIVRPDGTHQVKYNGKPLYLFVQDAYIKGIVGTAGINGAGKITPWGSLIRSPAANQARSLPSDEGPAQAGPSTFFETVKRRLRSGPYRCNFAEILDTPRQH